MRCRASAGAQKNPGQTAGGTAASETQVLSETTDEAGRTFRRVADGSGSIVEQTSKESGEVLVEVTVGEHDRGAGEEVEAFDRAI